MKVTFDKKERSDHSLSVRLPKTTLDKLRKLSKTNNVSQAEIVKKLIEAYYLQETNKK